MARKTTAPKPATTPTARAQKTITHHAAGPGSWGRRPGSFDCSGSFACILPLLPEGPDTGSRVRVGRFARARGVLRVIFGEQPLLLILLWEDEEDEHGAEQDRDDPGNVGPLTARQERRFRRGSNLARVSRIVLRGVGRAAE